MDGLSEDKKWAEKLSSQCGLGASFLKDVLKELSEGCFGDAATSKQVIEELTLSCHLDEKELRRFIGEVSKNCPFDAKKLKEDVLKAGGRKDKLFESMMTGSSLWTEDRGGAR